MNVARGFLLIGILYLLVGMGLGMYMGPTEDFRLAPVHAHINLVGFTLMTVFAVVYKVFPALADNGFARLHFWLHQVGALVMVGGLFLMLGEFVAGATIGPVLSIGEVAMVLGTLIFGWNVLKNAA